MNLEQLAPARITKINEIADTLSKAKISMLLIPNSENTTAKAIASVYAEFMALLEEALAITPEERETILKESDFLSETRLEELESKAKRTKKGN